MRTHDVIASTGAWVLERGHRLLLALTGGRFPRTVMGMLTLELHTVGRKSGRRYSTLLTAPVHDEHRIVVVASKGGHSDHPDWYKNALANPDVSVTVDGVDEPVHARPATPEERSELWPQVVRTYRGYAGYQRRTDREIPLLILERKR
ncbi:MAG: nitroreductase/quinone reductase family protein [Mycolicibacterium hassiacum]|jgi:deazaflavin-dependent oxidoreductase (nitroreductase family)|uniref:nitroreductase/quinone reductase family protein n=1 Tax=Mycolicibacterium hassiacum TaxID=46351 RepID=UPI000DB5BA29|nr:nitroreductase/quinone reductase family protein [Mycolicibacterium hassiacum]MBX5486187.1 nitroreductase family deazaflavin-dependent oxidoreductase [Mycolicibacterium hassiacum]PZN25414.1 MAG: nitroreductase family deazaflavin-dependent oxidoreductase [Mycolicibacterium hassiacum]